MKKILITLALVALMPVLATPAAEAGIFSAGVSFNVGGLFFDLGFGGPHYSAHDGHHVYRVNEPFHYRGYQCHSGCYRVGGYSYHHANCPAVAYHFRTHRFDPYVSYSSFFGPRAYGYYNYGNYGSRYNYYRYDRHRYDRNRHYRDHRRGYRPRHYDGRHQGEHYRYDDRRRDRSHRYDRQRDQYRRDDRGRDHSQRYDSNRRNGHRRGASSTRQRGQSREHSRDRDRNPRR